MFCRQCASPVVETDLFCATCGTPRLTQAPLQDDPGFGHLLRFVGVGMALGVSSWFVIGIFWQAHILSRTGYRKRDLLLLFVPGYGSYVSVVTLWRYTALEPYWTPRDDRPSDVLRGWQRPAAIAAGWVLVPLMILATIVAIVVVVVTNIGWDEAERQDLVDAYIVEGFDPPVAKCIADEIIDDYPLGPSTFEADVDSAASEQVAVDTCALR